MSKLFIFAIGGTGSRVMKALTMLLASGVKLNNVSEIVPIIVDPHKANLDLKRTEDILNNYKKIRDSFKPTEDGDFFHTEIKKLKEVVKGDGIEDTYAFQLKGVSDETFKDYIDFNTLGAANDNGELYGQNKDLINLLYSEKQLNTNMDIGFVGNPNIGSVVLNQFRDSDAFRHFASNFGKDDRVFIISSIFGGTGAAGFPILLKNIRGAEAGVVENPEFLRNAKIGAITVQPYFGLEPNEEKMVDKATFYSKTKAALQYYSRGVNKSVDRLYYIGDEVISNFKYDPGNNGQKNDAHFIEMAAATSIIDFANTPDKDFDGGQNGRRFMIKNNLDELNFDNLTERTKFIIGTALAKYTTFCLYLEHSLDGKIGGTLPWIKDTPALDRSFIQGSFFHSYLKAFNQSYIDWLNEMGKNKRAFKPFNLGTDLTHLIVGQEPKKGFFGLGATKATFDDVDEALNKYTNGKPFPSQEVRLLKAFSKGLDKFMSSKFPNF
ncbi:hypothetical protein EGI22_16070 [Lacihabitans sp. LS3-19]|uniref:hypothetical protein n=1 Tax=Lacihabitans sp. LS3-19 TaxID=2487335 RepID=UPI0020CF1687|nr:hypothetical protein [Lacihabitans sp. LS3-19]MCP9769420.1 hypothetical protein [Lacihabitans sp. LS3-19]